jgi:hypothetical protein
MNPVILHRSDEGDFFFKLLFYFEFIISYQSFDFLLSSMLYGGPACHVFGDFKAYHKQPLCYGVVI